jgi:hypothetical protein
MDLFVERTFELGSDRTVTLRIFRPVPHRGDFRCDIRIQWPDRERATQAYGVDSLQALYLALQKAHIVLAASAEQMGGGLTWLGDEDLDLPVFKAIHVPDPA